MTIGPRIISSPTSPRGMVFEASATSAMRASTCGSAMPIEPSLCGPFEGNVVPRPASSVMPHSSISGQPKRFSTSCILATGIVCPPTVQRVSEERSNRDSSGCASMYMYMVGTPSNIVAW